MPEVLMHHTSDCGLSPLKVFGNGPYWNAEVANEVVLYPLDKLSRHDDVWPLRMFVFLDHEWHALARGQEVFADLEHEGLNHI